MDNIEIKVHKVYDLLSTGDSVSIPETTGQLSIVKDEGCCCKTLEKMREDAKEQGLRYVTMPSATPVSPIVSEAEIEKYLLTCGEPVSIEQRITEECDSIKSILLLKNKCYGNSAAEPIRIFSKSDPLEQMRVRIDDKLSRIAKGTEYPGDDTILDLIGYLVLYRILSKED